MNIDQHIKLKNQELLTYNPIKNMPCWNNLTIDKNEMKHQTKMNYELLNVTVEVN